MDVFKIAQRHSILEVVGCTFTNNSALGGGAILAEVGAKTTGLALNLNFSENNSDNSQHYS